MPEGRLQRRTVIADLRPRNLDPHVRRLDAQFRLQRGLRLAPRRPSLCSSDFTPTHRALQLISEVLRHDDKARLLLELPSNE